MKKDMFEAWEHSGKLGRVQEWMKWVKEIPYIQFKKEWLVKTIPPFGGAVARFLVSEPGIEKRVSIYLDCYDLLGCFGEPYWEVYPYDGDVFRCKMNDTKTLLEAIQKSLDEC